MTIISRKWFLGITSLTAMLLSLLQVTIIPLQNWEYWKRINDQPDLDQNNCRLTLKLKLRWRTASQWWMRVLTISPLSTSQTRTVLSDDPEMITWNNSKMKIMNCNWRFINNDLLVILQAENRASVACEDSLVLLQRLERKMCYMIISSWFFWIAA